MATFKSPDVWYLAYGSNMRSSVMTGRGIKPLDAKTVVAPRYYLTFDISGVPYAEPSFASVAEFPDDIDNKDETLKLHLGTTAIPVLPVHGIAYLLTARDYNRLVVTEGGGVAYDEISLEALVLTEGQITSQPSSQKIIARTLKAKYPRRPNGSPSARYLGLLIQGCKEHRLPLEYLNYISSMPSYTANYWNPGSLLFLLLWRPWLRILIRLIRIRTDENGHCPHWLGILILTVYEYMWSYHDRVHSRIWQCGDGTRLEFRRS